MTVTNTKQSAAEYFIERLGGLDRGDKAILRRSAGLTIADARSATGLFYAVLPGGIAGAIDEEIFFLIATLFPLNNYQFKGNFGGTMRLVRERSGSSNLDMRMRILLDSEFDIIDGFRRGGGELAFRLRQCVKLANGNEVGVDWLQLLTDLRYWDHPERRVRKSWAAAYFSSNSDDKKDETNKEVTSDVS